MAAKLSKRGPSEDVINAKINYLYQVATLIQEQADQMLSVSHAILTMHALARHIRSNADGLQGYLKVVDNARSD